MNVSVTEMVMQRGSYTAAEAEELQVAMGGGMSIVRDNTLEVCVNVFVLSVCLVPRCA